MLKHTQNLMMGSKVDDAKVVPQDPTARRRFMDELAGDIQDLQRLTNSPGWALFTKDLEVEEYDILRRMEMAQDPISLGKLTGCLLVVKSFRTWAQDRTTELQGVLQDMDPK